MDVSSLPFNQRVGIVAAEGTGGGLALPQSAETLNHLGTVHASAEFALAEAASGQYLIDAFPTLAGQALAVLRSFSVSTAGRPGGCCNRKPRCGPKSVRSSRRTCSGAVAPRCRSKWKFAMREGA